MSQTLFSIQDKVHIKLSQGVFEVENPQLATYGKMMSGAVIWKPCIKDDCEWPGKVELIEIDTVEDGGGCYVAGSKTVARLLPEEKKDYPSINYPKSNIDGSRVDTPLRPFELSHDKPHSYTESAYKEVESSEPQEKEPYILEVFGNFLHSSGLVFNTDDADHVASDLIRYLKVEGISIAKSAPSESQEDVINRHYMYKIECENRVLKDKLKESEHLKELADDAIVSLQKEVERLKAEQKGLAPRMFICSSTGCSWGCSWPNCDCSRL